MAIDFNHTIVSARDSKASAEFLAEMLGLPAPRTWGPFQMVTTENGANIDFMNTEGEITAQHYAFLVSEPEFDQIFGRIRKRSLPVHERRSLLEKLAIFNYLTCGHFHPSNGLPTTPWTDTARA
jgi:hypothetical protein